jgi:hypothetical protein
MTVKITLDPEMSGSLGYFGYRMRDSTPVRRAALAKAMEFWGSAYVIRKLNVLYIYNKAKYPEHADIFKADRDWIGRVRNALPPEHRIANKAKHSKNKKDDFLRVVKKLKDQK